jgi:DNA polymerase III, beta subunit
MKFSVLTSEFSSVVFNLLSAVTAKTSDEIVSGIFIKSVSDNVIELRAYNFEFCIHKRIEAQIEKGGEVLVNAKLLAESLRRFRNEVTKIETDENGNIVINNGRTSIKCSGLNAEEFPESFIVNEENMVKAEIKGEDFKKLISSVSYATMQGGANIVYGGVKVEVKDKKITFAAVDGFRLAIKKSEIDCDEEFSFICPVRTLNEVSKFIKEDEDVVDIINDNKNILFKINNFDVYGTLIASEFIDYEKIIPLGKQDVVTKATVNVGGFINSVETAGIVVQERTKEAIRLSVSGTVGELSSASLIGRTQSGVEESFTEVEDLFEIGFNEKYMVDALKAIDDENVVIHFFGAVTSMVITPVEGDDYLHLLLPIRLTK